MVGGSEVANSARHVTTCPARRAAVPQALRVWHACEHACLQAVSLPFTCLAVPGRRLDYGARSLYPGPPAAAAAPAGSGLADR